MLPLEGDDLPAVVARLMADCQCAVCHELLVAPHAVACGHSFCGECIASWLRARPTCPSCRAHAGKPAYERALDDVLCAIVEPRLDAEATAERSRRKREWQAMQLEAAREAREEAAAREARVAAAGGGGLDAGFRSAMERVPYLELHRMLRQSTEQLQAEMRTLQQRFAAAAEARARGAGGAGGGVGGNAGNGAATGRDAADAAGGAAAPGVTWSVEYARSGRTVCHTCFTGIGEATVRVVREAAPPPWADLLEAALPQAPLIRDFHHVQCRVPTCAFGDVRGMGTLRADDQARVQSLMAAAATAAAEAAAAAPQEADDAVADDAVAVAAALEPAPEPAQAPLRRSSRGRT